MNGPLRLVCLLLEVREKYALHHMHMFTYNKSPLKRLNWVEREQEWASRCAHINTRCLIFAKIGGHKDVLKWALENGCEWDGSSVHDNGRYQLPRGYVALN